MKSMTITILAFVAVMGLVGAGLVAAGAPDLPDKPDPITGEWAGTFEVNGHTAEVTLKLKLDGDRVAGTADSEHTGPGTLSKGMWSKDKLSFTMDFAAHESIAVTAVLKGGTLTGEFRTEGMVGTWEARRK